MSDQSSCDKPRVAVLGLGHVGLPTALGFVEMGWEVIGADEDASKVAKIRSGQVPFYEPGLDDLLARGLASGRLTLSHSVEEAVRTAANLVCLHRHPSERDGRNRSEPRRSHSPGHRAQP